MMAPVSGRALARHGSRALPKAARAPEPSCRFRCIVSQQMIEQVESA